MSTAELMRAIDKLPHAEKFQLAQFLLVQLAEEDGVALTQPSPAERPRPVGRVYRSGCDDVSANARELLFAEKRRSTKDDAR